MSREGLKYGMGGVVLGRISPPVSNILFWRSSAVFLSKVNKNRTQNCCSNLLNITRVYVACISLVLFLVFVCRDLSDITQNHSLMEVCISA